MKERIKQTNRTKSGRAAEAATASAPADNGWDEKYAALCRGMAAAYVIIGFALAGMYALRKAWYPAAQSLGTIAVLWAVFALLKLLKIKPVYSLYAIIIGFIFSAYTLGVACGLYRIVPLYDKLLHMFSGTFVMMLAPALFCALKAGHRIEKTDCVLAAVFCILTSLSVAGLWEIAEYVLSLLTGIDPQNVLASGVSDTMQDMMVCMLGTLAAVPSLIRFCRGDGVSVLYAPVQVFIRKNFPEKKKSEREDEGE